MTGNLYYLKSDNQKVKQPPKKIDLRSIAVYTIAAVLLPIVLVIALVSMIWKVVSTKKTCNHIWLNDRCTLCREKS